MDTAEDGNDIIVQIIDTLGSLIANVKGRFPEDIEALDSYTRLRIRAVPLSMVSNIAADTRSGLMQTLQAQEQHSVAEYDSRVVYGSGGRALDTIFEEMTESTSGTPEKDRTTKMSQVLVNKEAIDHPEETRTKLNDDPKVSDSSSSTIVDTAAEEAANSASGDGATETSQVVVAREKIVDYPPETRDGLESFLERFGNKLTKDLEEEEEDSDVEHGTR